jgi:hypothetical protein
MVMAPADWNVEILPAHLVREFRQESSAGPGAERVFREGRVAIYRFAPDSAEVTARAH